MKLIKPAFTRVASLGAALGAAAGLAAFAGAAGCSHDAWHAATPTRAASSASTDRPQIRVPLPERTPFDDDPKLRDVYREFYTNGYTLAATDTEYASPGCLCEANGDPRKYEAMAEGFFAGRKAGTEAFQALQQRAE